MNLTSINFLMLNRNIVFGTCTYYKRENFENMDTLIKIKYYQKTKLLFKLTIKQQENKIFGFKNNKILFRERKYIGKTKSYFN